MNTDDRLDIVIALLQDILSSLQSNQSINQSTNQPGKVRSDLINLDPSDQIRSDQSNLDSNLLSNFLDICDSLGINARIKDLSTAGRSIQYYLEQKTIRNHKAYINSILSKLPDLPRIGFDQEHSVKPTPTKLAEIDTDVMGIPLEVVQAKSSLLCEKDFYTVREFIPQFKAMFRTWNDCKDSLLKRNVLTAYCIINHLPGYDD